VRRRVRNHDLHPDTLADSDNLKAKPLVLEGLAPVQRFAGYDQSSGEKKRGLTLVLYKS